MATYYCTVGNINGEIKELIVESDSVENLKRKIFLQGYYPIKIERQSIFKFARNLAGNLFGYVGNKEIINFFTQLSSLISAGIALVDALTVLNTDIENPVLRNEIIFIIQDVSEGISFSEAIKKRKVFPEFISESLKAGEISGNLDKVINNLVDVLKKQAVLKRKFISALIYPVIILLASIVVLSYLLVKVVPVFSNMYKEMEVALPFLTRVVITTSIFIKENIFLILLLIIGVIIEYRARCKSSNFSLKIDRLKLKLPVIGSLVFYYSVSQFLKSFSLLISSGLSCIPALSIASSSLHNKELRRRLNIVINLISSGLPVSYAFSEQRLLPPTGISILKSGEESGRLSELIRFLAEQLDEEIDILTERISALIEPFLMIFVGICVVIIIIALYLPLFDMIGQVR